MLRTCAPIASATYCEVCEPNENPARSNGWPAGKSSRKPAATVAAIVAKCVGGLGSALSPKPGRSGAHTSRSAANASMLRIQCRHEPEPPCSRTKGRRFGCSRRRPAPPYHHAIAARRFDACRLRFDGSDEFLRRWTWHGRGGSVVEFWRTIVAGGRDRQGAGRRRANAAAKLRAKASVSTPRRCRLRASRMIVSAT